MNLYIRVTEIRVTQIIGGRSYTCTANQLQGPAAPIVLKQESQITTLSDDMSLREETKGLQHL